MSYPRDLDEIPTSELLHEIYRRTKVMEEGNCPYCAHALATHSCKYAEGKGNLWEYHDLATRPTALLPEDTSRPYALNQKPGSGNTAVELDQLLLRVNSADCVEGLRPPDVNDHTRKGAYIQTQIGISYETHFIGIGRRDPADEWRLTVERCG